jgi:hypothetical protein
MRIQIAHESDSTVIKDMDQAVLTFENGEKLIINPLMFDNGVIISAHGGSRMLISPEAGSIIIKTEKE